MRPAEKRSRSRLLIGLCVGAPVAAIVAVVAAQLINGWGGPPSSDNYQGDGSPTEMAYREVLSRAGTSWDQDGGESVSDQVERATLEHCLGATVVADIRGQLGVSGTTLNRGAQAGSGLAKGLVDVVGPDDVGKPTCSTTDRAGVDDRGDDNGEVDRLPACQGGGTPVSPVRLVYVPAPGATVKQSTEELLAFLDAMALEASTASLLIERAQMLYIGDPGYATAVSSLAWTQGGDEGSELLDPLTEMHDGALPPASLLETVLHQLIEVDPPGLVGEETATMVDELQRAGPILFVSHGRGALLAEALRAAGLGSSAALVALGSPEAPGTAGRVDVTIANDPVVFAARLAGRRTLTSGSGSAGALWPTYQSLVVKRFGSGTPIGRIFSSDFAPGHDPVELATGLLQELERVDPLADTGESRAYLDALHLTEIGMLSARSLPHGYLEEGTWSRSHLISAAAGQLSALACREPQLTNLDLDETVGPANVVAAEQGGVANEARMNERTAWRIEARTGDRLVLAIQTSDCRLDATVLISDENDHSLAEGDPWIGADGCRLLGPFRLDPAKSYQVYIQPTDRDPSLGANGAYSLRAWRYEASPPRPIDLGSSERSTLTAPLAADTWSLDVPSGMSSLRGTIELDTTRCGLGLIVGVQHGERTADEVLLPPPLVRQSCTAIEFSLTPDEQGVQVVVQAPAGAGDNGPISYQIQFDERA